MALARLENYAPEERERWEDWYAAIQKCQPGDPLYFDWSAEKQETLAAEVEEAKRMFAEKCRLAREQTRELIFT